MNYKSKAASCIFLGLAKAFDAVNHKILIDEMNYLGIRGNALQLFNTDLKNPFQSVRITNHAIWGAPRSSSGPSLLVGLNK